MSMRLFRGLHRAAIVTAILGGAVVAVPTAEDYLVAQRRLDNLEQIRERGGMQTLGTGGGGHLNDQGIWIEDLPSGIQRLPDGSLWHTDTGLPIGLNDGGDYYLDRSETIASDISQQEDAAAARFWTILWQPLLVGSAAYAALMALLLTGRWVGKGFMN